MVSGRHFLCHVDLVDLAFILWWFVVAFFGWFWGTVGYVIMWVCVCAWNPEPRNGFGFVQGVRGSYTGSRKNRGRTKCGPQILVTTMYLSGAIPLSAQIGNAISNDGDALFPAIAIAPRVAIVATLYSAVPALLISYGWLFLVEQP